jgi:hypothetical protein
LGNEWADGRLPGRPWLALPGTEKVAAAIQPFQAASIFVMDPVWTTDYNRNRDHEACAKLKADETPHSNDWLVPSAGTVLAAGNSRLGPASTGLADLAATTAHRHNHRGYVRSSSGHSVSAGAATGI